MSGEVNNGWPKLLELFASEAAKGTPA